MKIKQMALVSIGSAKNLFLVLFLRTWVTGYNLVVHRKLARPSTNFARHIYNSTLFSGNARKYYKWDATWEHSYQLWNRGEYSKSVALRSEVMEDVYLQNNVYNSEYAPPFLSNDFCGPFGHNPLIAIHAMAQNQGLLQSGKRSLTASKSVSLRPFIQNLAGVINVIPHENPDWNRVPSEWHLAERLQLFKTREGFSDNYPIIEKVFNNFNLGSDEPMFELLPEYESYARLRLEEYGLSKSDWFVTIHVRNTGSSIDVREQSIKDYLASINLIIANGGKVIRIGDPSMEKINAIPGFIDLSRDSKLHSPLHLYALAKAKFFIGTNSGPKMYPPLYGVPSLITNLTSIGLETFSLSPGTIYIPKTYTREGEKLPLMEILGSHIGYDNFNRRQLFERGIGVADTSQLDILKGVEEMLQYVFGLAPERNNEFDIQVERIRSTSQFSTSGLFSATWLSENENWFLRT